MSVLTKNKSIEQIVAPMKKILAELEAFAAKKDKASDELANEIARMTEDRNVAEADAKAARSLMGKYRELIA